jgi:hypothetical protein
VTEPIDEPVPKLPRGRGMKFSGPEIFRILLTLATLVGVVVLARPCANAVSGFVTSFDGSETGNRMPKPGNVDVPAPAPPQMEVLRPDMTDEEIRAAIERSKARAAGGGGANGDGSAAIGGGSAAIGGGGATSSGAPSSDPTRSGAAKRSE